jgi:hypothetical protein
MASFRFLTDHSVGQFYYPAGSTAQTADVPGGTLPLGFVSPNVDPLDGDALSAYWDAGAASLEFRESSNSFNNATCAPTMWRSVRAITYWTLVGGLWTLTGLGVGYRSAILVR